MPPAGSPVISGMLITIDVCVLPASILIGALTGSSGIDTIRAVVLELLAEYDPGPSTLTALTIATISSPLYKLYGEPVNVVKLTSQYKLVLKAVVLPSHSAFAVNVVLSLFLNNTSYESMGTRAPPEYGAIIDTLYCKDVCADTTEIYGGFMVAGTVAARTASGSDSGPSP